MLRYFIITILQTTSAGEGLMYDCRVVNDQYREIFRETCNEEEKDIFEKIMASDKGALLYLKHPRLGHLATFKMDEQQKQTIIDGTKWP